MIVKSLRERSEGLAGPSVLLSFLARFLEKRLLLRRCSEHRHSKKEMQPLSFGLGVSGSNLADGLLAPEWPLTGPRACCSVGKAGTSKEAGVTGFPLA